MNFLRGKGEIVTCNNIFHTNCWALLRSRRPDGIPRHIKCIRLIKFRETGDARMVDTPRLNKTSAIPRAAVEGGSVSREDIQPRIPRHGSYRPTITDPSQSDPTRPERGYEARHDLTHSLALALLRPPCSSWFCSVIFLHFSPLIFEYSKVSIRFFEYIER